MNIHGEKKYQGNSINKQIKKMDDGNLRSCQAED